MGRRADAPQTEAGRAIWKALEKLERDGHSRSRYFTDWLDLMLNAYLSQSKHIAEGHTDLKPKNEYEDAYMEIVSRYADNHEKGERAIDCFAEAHAALSLGVLKDGDPLGDVYMSAISFGEHGQYFTPYHIADTMAQLAMGEIKDGQTVLDPSCGSGIMLIAAAKKNPKALLYGIDLDERCAKMCVLNLAFRELNGSVWCGNALTDEMYTRWDIKHGWIVRDDNPRPIGLNQPGKDEQLTLL